MDSRQDGWRVAAPSRLPCRTEVTAGSLGGSREAFSFAPAVAKTAASPARHAATELPLSGVAYRPLEAGKVLICGGLAGCVAKTTMAPLSRLTVVAQTSGLLDATVANVPAAGGGICHPRGLGDSLVHIVKCEGLPALWKGNMLTIAHRFPFQGINFAVFETLRSYPGCSQGSTMGCFVPGAVAACVAVTVTYPAEMLRTRHMAYVAAGSGKASRSDELSRHCREIGKFPGVGWYRGLGSALIATVPAYSISFGFYVSLRERLNGHSPFLTTLLAGGTSGLAATILTYPLDTLRRRLQVMGMPSVHAKRSCGEEIRHILERERFRDFFRGLGPELLKAFPTVAITFLTFESLKANFL
jgi:hypothetical protein